MSAISPKTRIILEVCVDDVAGLEAAIAGGADRIELCSALEAGGLSPSPGLLAAASTSPIPVFAMIRPRAGDFPFNERDVTAMLRDIDAVRSAGLAGVVLGAGLADGSLDVEVLERLCRASAGLGKTLHRAVDLCPDQVAAVDIAIELDFDRILSSGGAPNAFEGLETLKAMNLAASGRLSIMPGSGITAENAASVVSVTGAREVHASCSSYEAWANKRIGAMGFAGKSRRYTDVDKVARLRRVLDVAGR